MDELIGPKPQPKTVAYTVAITKAVAVTEKIRPKLMDRVPLTTSEGERLLNSNWQMYLYAMKDGDLPWAGYVAEFVQLVESVLRIQGFIVELSAEGKYCVYQKPTRRIKHHGK